jgi:hypothetical protein
MKIKLISPKNDVKFSLIDNEDFEFLQKWEWKWTLQGYAVKVKALKGDKNTHRAMHRLIMGAKEGTFIDHINRDKLDNRKINLRFCTFQQNTWNRAKVSDTRGYKSKYKGVGWDKKQNKWFAMIYKDYIDYHLGFYDLETEAATAYNEAAKKHFGEFAYLNNV